MSQSAHGALTCIPCHDVVEYGQQKLLGVALTQAMLPTIPPSLLFISGELKSIISASPSFVLNDCKGFCAAKSVQRNMHKMLLVKCFVGISNLITCKMLGFLHPPAGVRASYTLNSRQ